MLGGYRREPGGGRGGCEVLLNSCGGLLRGCHEGRNVPLNVLCFLANLQGLNSLPPLLQGIVEF